MTPKTLKEAGLKPKLKKFQQNIYWDIDYSNSAVYDYVESFKTGFDMQIYSFADECFAHTADSLDLLYNFNIEMIRRKSWNDPFQLLAQSTAVDLNNAWFYCFQFVSDFNMTFHDKFSKFQPCNVMYENQNGA